jgi:ubiquinone/menaquinone biosynthesis C-methylase UbiE
MDAVFMSFTLELLDTPEIPTALGECKRVLLSHRRVVVVGMSTEGRENPMTRVFKWTHKHFPNFLDCRPIYVGAALEQAGFRIARELKNRMWIPVEIVMGVRP